MTLVIKEPLPPYCLPFELLTWQPQPSDIKTVFKNGDYERKIHLNIEVDPGERELIKEVRKLQRETQVPLKRTMEARILRHISHARGDPRKALESLISTQEWRRNFFTPRMTDRMDSMGQYLTKGFAYFCGRDSGHRPLLFVKPIVAFLEGWDLPICEKMFAFCLEFALRYLFLPGKVETVVVVLDVGGCSTWQLRGEELRSVAAMLSKQYVGRLYQLMVVNAPMFVAGLWTLAKNFISDRQQAKTVFCKHMKDVCAGRCAKHQVEVQYGGSIPKLTTFYPFTLPPAPFTADYAGPPNTNSVPLAHKCVNHVTVTGTLAEEGVGVQPLKWSQKGAKILAQANIFLRVSDREYPSKTERATWMTDFPDSDADEDVAHKLESTEHHHLSIHQDQRRDFSRTSFEPPLKQISEIEPFHVPTDQVRSSNSRWTTQDHDNAARFPGDPQFDERRQSSPSFTDTTYAINLPSQKFHSGNMVTSRSSTDTAMTDYQIDDRAEDDYSDHDDSDSAISERIITAEDARAALARLALYEKRLANQNSFFSPFACCTARSPIPQDMKEDVELRFGKEEIQV